MKTTIEPLEIAALVMAGRLPLRETVKLYDGAVVIRTVAKRESEPTLQPIKGSAVLPDLTRFTADRVIVSVKFLERLNAEIEADKRMIVDLRTALEKCEREMVYAITPHTESWKDALKSAQTAIRRSVENSPKQTT